MNYHIRTVLDRPKVDWTRESRIHDERNSLGVSKTLQRTELDHPAGRVHRRLQENHPRRFAQRFAPGTRFERIHEGDLDSHAWEVLGEQRPRPAVNPGAGHE